MLNLTRRVVRMGRSVSVKVIGQVAAPVVVRRMAAVAQPAVKRPTRPPAKPRHPDELVAAAKALRAVGIGPTRIAELLKIPEQHEMVKWWTRGESRKHVRMADTLYETIMKAIEQSITRES